jgi:hypothetical protein
MRLEQYPTTLSDTIHELVAYLVVSDKPPLIGVLVPKMEHGRDFIRDLRSALYKKGLEHLYTHNKFIISDYGSLSDKFRGYDLDLFINVLDLNYPNHPKRVDLDEIYYKCRLEKKNIVTVINF